MGSLTSVLFADNPFIQLTFHRLRRRRWRLALSFSAYLLGLALASCGVLFLIDSPAVLGVERGMIAMTLVAWVHVIALLICGGGNDTFTEDLAKRRLEFIRLCPLEPIRVVIWRFVYPAIRSLCFTLLAFPFYWICWMMSSAELTMLLTWLLLVTVLGTRIALWSFLIWTGILMYVATRYGTNLAFATPVRLFTDFLLLPMTTTEWLVRVQSFYSLSLFPLPALIAWIVWTRVNHAYADTSFLTLRNTPVVPSWFVTARRYVGVLTLLVIVGFVWQGFIVTGIVPSLFQTTGARQVDALGGFLLLILLVIGKPAQWWDSTQIVNANVNEVDSFEPVGEHDVSAQRDMKPADPQVGWLLSGVRMWIRSYLRAAAIFLFMLLLARTNPFSLGLEFLAGVLAITVVDVVLMQSRQWRNWMMAGKRLPPAFDWIDRLYGIARFAAVPLSMTVALIPEELAFLSPPLGLLLLSPFASRWDHNIEWLHLPASPMIHVLIGIPLLAELINCILIAIAVQFAQDREYVAVAPGKQAPVIQWHPWEQNLMDRNENPIFTFHYERWRRTTPHLPARFVSRCAALLILLPLILSSWIAPLGPRLVAQWGEVRATYLMATVVGLALCLCLGVSPTSKVGSVLWKERTSGFIEQLLLTPLSDREIIRGWLAAVAIASLSPSIPICAASLVSACAILPNVAVPLMVLVVICSIPAVAMLLLAIDASTAWQQKQIDLEKQSQAGPVFQMLIFGGVLAAPFAEVALSVAAVAGALCWVVLPLFVWVLTRQFRTMRRSWGERYAARSP